MCFDDQADKEVVAERIAKRLKKYRFVVSPHFLCDILSTLGQLNKTFQISMYHPFEAQRKVSEVIQALKRTDIYKKKFDGDLLLRNACKQLKIMK